MTCGAPSTTPSTTVAARRQPSQGALQLRTFTEVYWSHMEGWMELAMLKGSKVGIDWFRYRNKVQRRYDGSQTAGVTMVSVAAPVLGH